jgi:hypothetical protein
MANPDWAINILERSETVVDFFRKNGFPSSTSISNLGDILRKGYTESGIPLPPGRMYHSLEHCAVSNFVEGCYIGGGISILVSVAPALLKGNIRRATASVATIGNLRTALFFGSLMSACNTGVFIQIPGDGTNKLQKMRLLRNRTLLRILIGFISGLSVSVLPRSTRRFIVYFLLTRSIEIGARILKARYRSRKPMLSPIQEADMFSSHEVVGVASVSMAVIITAWFRYTSLVPKGYLQFLQGINNLTATQVQDVQAVLKHDCERRDLRNVISGDVRFCSVIHPVDQACLDFYARFLIKGILTRSGPFYLKLYSVPLLFSIIRRKGKMSKDMITTHFLKRVWWSSLFLATMNATAAGTVCALHHITSSTGTHNIVPLTARATMGGAVSGLSLYLEQDTRRLELSLYLFGQAIQILVNAYVHAGLWSPRGLDVFFCASSISMLMYAFWEQQERSNEPVIMRPGYATLISRIIDTTESRHSFKM